jgi:UDP-glucose 4-epimerase
VTDIVEWLLLLASNEDAVGKVFNLGSPHRVTIEDLARKVIAVTEAKVSIDHIPYEKAYRSGFEDMERRAPNIDKIRALTGYEPQVGLQQALELIRDWFMSENILQKSKTFVHTPIAVSAPA